MALRRTSTRFGHEVWDFGLISGNNSQSSALQLRQRCFSRDLCQKKSLLPVLMGLSARI